MGSVMNSGQFTCCGCFISFKWDTEKVEKHCSSCEEYQKEIKSRHELWAKAESEGRITRLGPEIPLPKKWLTKEWRETHTEFKRRDQK